MKKNEKVAGNGLFLIFHQKHCSIRHRSKLILGRLQVQSPVQFFTYFRHFNAVESKLMCNIIFAYDWIRTTDLRYRKRSIYQLSSNHCQSLFMLLFFVPTFVVQFYIERSSWPTSEYGVPTGDKYIV